MSVQIQKEIQQLSTDNLVELIEFVANDGTVFRFCSSIDTVEETQSDGSVKQVNRNVRYGLDANGQPFEYAVFPFKFERVRQRITGALPRPHLIVSNVGNAFGTIAEGFVGFQLRRIRTFRKFLFGYPDFDPNAHFPIEVYYVNAKASHTYDAIAFELISYLDKEQMRVPKRTIVKNSCTHSYRTYNTETGTFDYSKVTCPYRGAQYYGLNNILTSLPAEDRCTKTIQGCRIRFGDNIPLPTRAFPGVRR